MAPRKNYKKKPYKKKKGAARRRGGRMTGNFQRTAMVRPDRLIVKMPYMKNWFIATSTTASVASIFRLNSVFDPDMLASATTSATGLSLYQGLYNRYRVFGASVELTIDNGTNGISVPGLICPAETNLTTYNYLLAATQPRSIRFMLGNGAGQSRYVKKLYFSLPNIRGQTSTEYKGDNTNQSLLSSNPTNAIFLNMLLGPTTGGCGVTFNMRIVYHVELFDPCGVLQTVTPDSLGVPMLDGTELQDTYTEPAS